MEKSCKNCKYYREIENKESLNEWFECIYKNGKFASIAPCDDHEFATEPAAPTWQPKNPDEFDIGCGNERCRFHNKNYVTQCRAVMDGLCLAIKKHEFLCENVACYDPKPKPKMQKFLVFKGEFSDELEKKLMDILNEKKYSLEIVEEEVDKYVD